jgi:hypothetical protein
LRSNNLGGIIICPAARTGKLFYHFTGLHIAEVELRGRSIIFYGVLPMPIQVLLSIILITLALIFYSIGVWSERIAGRLKSWHLAFFWAGFVCDTTGTG